MSHKPMDLFDELYTEMQKRSEAVEELVLSGGASSYAHYCELTGKINGIREGMATFKEIVKTRLQDE